MTTILFKNATLVDGTSSEAREGFDVLVENDRIKEVSDKPVKAPSGAETHDLAGKTLMPGLIDAHVHVKATMLNLGRLNEVPVSYLHASAAQIMKAMLMRGFTSVRDAAGADRGMADAVDHNLVVGPRLFVSGLALSQTGGHCDFRLPTEFSTIITCACQVSAQQLGRIADGADECRRAARDELRKGAHQLKIMAGGGVASPTDPIQNTQYSVDEIRAIVEECEAWHTYAMAHAYTPHAIRRVVECGVRCIEHGNLADEATAKLMAERGVFHVPTSITYIALNKHGREFGFPEVSLQKLQEIVESGLRAVELTRDAGVKVGHGSDLLGPLHKYQSDEFSLKAEVLGNHGAIKSATMVNAELLRCENDLGQVKPDFKADLIVVDGNPLDDIGRLENDGAHIPLVMRDGQIFKNELATA
ncbi:MAG: amidohydrolase family protein [Rhizobiales bacterium]|nr:amidohydrolase family protein [Hyphomicrobiales bacterium]